MSRIPLCIPNVGDLEGLNLQSCISSGFVSYAGPFVNDFERRMAAETGAVRSVAMSAGTTALHAGLIALGVKPNDLVIVPTLTFIASANAVSHCAATPWLLDCDEATWLLDATYLSNALTNECDRLADGSVRHRPTGRRVSAVLPVFTLGVPVDMDAICDVADGWGLPVLADAAAALGARYKNRPIGHTRARLSAMSFNANKIITTGGGGTLIGNDPGLMDLIHHMTTTARVRPGYDHDMVGFNYRMTNLQAAVGVAQLDRLAQFTAVKAHIAKRYSEAFEDLAGIEAFPVPAWAESNHWLSGIFLKSWDDARVANLRQGLIDAGIDVAPFWKPVHLQPPYASAPRTLSGVAESIWVKILPLPCSTSLTEHEQDRVIEAVRKQITAKAPPA